VKCEYRGNQRSEKARAQGLTEGQYDDLLNFESSATLGERELGCFIALTMGQQSWLRLLDIEHHEVLAGTDASMAPGFATAQALAESKASRTTTTGHALQGDGQSIVRLLEGWPMRGVEHVGGHVGEDDAPRGQLVQVCIKVG
jgi:hypothetical protein